MNWGDKLLAEVANLTSDRFCCHVGGSGALRQKQPHVGRCQTPRGRVRAKTVRPPIARCKRDFSGRECRSVRVTPQDQAQANAGSDNPRGMGKSVLAVAAPRRHRNREHLRYVAQQACLVCGRKPSDPHHLRYPQPRALGRKASDEFAVPPCSSHHRAVHRAGDEQASTRVNEGRIRPEQTTRAVNSDILSSVAGKAPE
jgi:hypothetical protein